MEPIQLLRHYIAMTKLRTTFKTILLTSTLITMAACSTNQATGRSQFTGLMPASSEASIGAQEHEKIIAEYGGVIKNQSLQNYVTSVGRKIVPNTERQDVQYTFTLLDSPVVNAFALPGGYVYVTRGILTLANSEAELAAVMAHEIGHVTARHSAERYSTSILTGLGATIASAAIGSQGVGQALGLGANLYLSSYSRSQEHEADDLGVRYLSKTGYDPIAMAGFLKSLEASSKLDAAEAGSEGGNDAPSYFSTHPVTSQRISQSTSEAGKYTGGKNKINRIEYMKAINGMTVGDSASQGFVIDNTFVHTDLGFAFDIPNNYKTQNSAQAFIAQSKSSNGGTVIFNGASKSPSQSIDNFLRQNVLKGDMAGARDFGTNTVNGIKTASVEKTGTVNGVKSNIRIIAYEWDADTVYQFTIAMPERIGASELSELQRSGLSLKRLSSSEKTKYRPKKMSFRVASSGDSVQSYAKRFPYNDGLNEMRFRTINGMSPTEQVRSNQAYKVITQ